MPDLSTLMLFAVASLALTATPGPDMLLIVSRSAAQGRGAGFATLAGIQCGTYLHALAAALGLSQLFVLVPAAYDVVRFAGAAYLGYLAWQTLRASSRPAEASAAQPSKLHSTTRMFVQGLLTNLLNPKMVLFVLALFPQFIVPDSESLLLQVMLLATILNGAGLLTNGVVILASSHLGAALGKDSRFGRAMNRILGAVFAGLAVKLVLTPRD